MKAGPEAAVRPHDSEPRAATDEVPLQLTATTRTCLDLARGLAAQLVLLGHAFDFFNVFSYLGKPDPPAQIQRLAVVAFFLLSGFLIARSIHRHLLVARQSGKPTFSPYLADRSARIYSGLVPALVVIAVIDSLPFDLFELDYFSGEISLRTTLGNLLQLQLFPGTEIEVFGTGIPLWTLAVEWWLYVLFGGILLGLQNGRWSVLAFLLLPLSALSFGFNALGGEGHGIALTWCYGAAAYTILYKARSVALPLPTGVLAAVASASVLGLSALYLAHLAPDHPAKAFDRGLALAAALAFLLALRATQSLRAAPPRWLVQLSSGLAGYSYTLYLVHFSLLTIFYEWRGEIADRTLLVLACLASNLTAILVAQFGEARRDLLRPRPTTTDPA